MNSSATGDHLNPVYHTLPVVKKIRTAYGTDRLFHTITLEQLFRPEVYWILERAAFGAHYRKQSIPAQHALASAPIPKKMIALLKSTELLTLVSRTIGKTVKQIDGTLFCLGAGDYTLLPDEKGLVRKAGINLIFEFTPRWNSAWGGAIIYRTDEGEARTILAPANSLTIIELRKDVQHYVKYINHHAGAHKKIFILGACSE